MYDQKIPQMVFFTFDDAVNPQVAAFYRELFDASRVNPNGCPIKMTLFISHSSTVYSLVREFYQKGMEIASHSVTHSNPNPNTFLDEAKKQKQNLAKKAKIPENEIKGWRSPFLKPLGDTQPDVLKQLGYEYDATLTIIKSNSQDKAPVPFTLDYGWPYDCKIQPCPKKEHKGFWEVPVISVKDYLDKYNCVYIDGCNIPPPSEELAYKFLWDNFENYYKTNRAPMGINMHASWFFYPDRKKAMSRFIKDILKLGDVYIVSVSQVIEWLRNPTPLSGIKEFGPWQCNGKNTSTSPAQKVFDLRKQNGIQRQQENVLQAQKNLNALRESAVAAIKDKLRTQQTKPTPRITVRPTHTPIRPSVIYMRPTPTRAPPRTAAPPHFLQGLRNALVIRPAQTPVSHGVVNMRPVQTNIRQGMVHIRPQLVQRISNVVPTQVPMFPWTRQQFLQHAPNSPRPSPLAPNYPLVRFWWRPPEVRFPHPTIRIVRPQQRIFPQPNLMQQNMQRHQELERQRQLEQQQALERQRLQEQERQETLNRQQALQRLQELHKQKEILQKQEQERQRLEQLKKQEEIRIQREQEMKRKIKQQKEQEKQRLLELKRQQELEQLRLQEVKKQELERKRLQQKEIEKQKLLELKRQQELERLRLEKVKNQEKTKKEESEKQNKIAKANEIHKLLQLGRVGQKLSRNRQISRQRQLEKDAIHQIRQLAETNFLRLKEIERQRNSLKTTTVPTRMTPKIGGKSMWQMDTVDLKQLNAPWRNWVTEKPSVVAKDLNKASGNIKLSEFKATPVKKSRKRVSFTSFKPQTVFSIDHLIGQKSFSVAKSGKYSETVPTEVIIQPLESKPIVIKAVPMTTPTTVQTTKTGRRTEHPIDSVLDMKLTTSKPKSTTIVTANPKLASTKATTITIKPNLATTKASTVPVKDIFSTKSNVLVVKPTKPHVTTTKQEDSMSVKRPKTKSINFLAGSCLQGVNCLLPNCLCKSVSPPNGLRPENTPQMVIISVDGSVDFHSYSNIQKIFEKTRLNPNGCPIKGTVFATDADSNYMITKMLHANGFEIALKGLKSVSYKSPKILARDIGIQRQKLEKNANIPASEVRGWRSPELKPLGDKQFEILRNFSLYDSTLITPKGPKSRNKLWPFTLEYGWREGCEIEDCPVGGHPGVWEVPIIPVSGPNNSRTCEYADSCANQPYSVKETTEFLMDNFNQYYRGSRAPFAIRLQQVWFHWHYTKNLSGLNKFLDDILKLGDVYVITIANMLEWMKDPTSLEKIKDFKPWSC